MSQLFESILKLKEYGFIHNEAPRIRREFAQLKREMKGVPVKVIRDRLCQEYNITESTFKAIMADGAERRRDAKKMKADRMAGW